MEHGARLGLFKNSRICAGMGAEQSVMRTLRKTVQPVWKPPDCGLSCITPHNAAPQEAHLGVGRAASMRHG